MLLRLVGYARWLAKVPVLLVVLKMSSEWVPLVGYDYRYVEMPVGLGGHVAFRSATTIALRKCSRGWWGRSLWSDTNIAVQGYIWFPSTSWPLSVPWLGGAFAVLGIRHA